MLLFHFRIVASVLDSDARIGSVGLGGCFDLIVPLQAELIVFGDHFVFFTPCPAIEQEPGPAIKGKLRRQEGRFRVNPPMKLKRQSMSLSILLLRPIMQSYWT